MEPYGIYWFEEPISIDDIDGHVRLSQSTDIRIASGENLYTRFPFRDMLAAQGIQVAQADVARAGGCLRKCARSRACGVIQRPVGAAHIRRHHHTVANMHLVAATANAPILELDVTYNPLMTDLAPNALHWHEGNLLPPTHPAWDSTLIWIVGRGTPLRRGAKYQPRNEAGGRQNFCEKCWHSS